MAPTPTTPAPGFPPTLAFIGGGNMARSLIGGLIDRGMAAARIHVAEPVDTLRDALARDFGVQVHEQAEQAAAAGEVWLLAVKPQVMRGVCERLSPLARTMRPLVVSIAAGITSAQLSRWLAAGGPDAGAIAVVRTMPNTPALLGAGITGLFAGPSVSEAQRAQAQALLQAAGTTVWIDDERLMDAVTAVSGSGPAYVFLLAEAMIDAGIEQGLPPETAHALATQTVLGAALMLTRQNEPPETLRARVTSPGGTTQAAIDAFEAGGFRALVARAIAAATRRGRELSASHE